MCGPRRFRFQVSDILLRYRSIGSIEVALTLGRNAALYLGFLGVYLSFRVVMLVLSRSGLQRFVRGPLKVFNPRS